MRVFTVRKNENSKTDCGETCMKKNIASLDWIIKDLNLTVRQPGMHLESPKFPTKHDQGLLQNFSLLLYPNGKDEEIYQNSFILDLKYHGYEDKSQILTMKIYFRVEFGNMIYIYESNAINYDYSTSVNVSGDLTPISPDADRDSMKIQCCLWIVGHFETVVNNDDLNTMQKPEMNLAKLMNNVNSNRSLFSDIVIVVGEKKVQKFKAHKYILAASSSYFKMRLNDHAHFWTLPDFEPEMFEKFLEFVYTGKCGNMKDFATKLYELGDFLGVETLKNACAGCIYKNTNVENCIDNLLFGCKYSIETLVFSCRWFMIKNYEEVSKTEKFKNFNNQIPDLVWDFTFKTSTDNFKSLFI